MKPLSDFIDRKEPLNWLSSYFYKIYDIHISISKSSDKLFYELKYKSIVFARVSILNEGISLNNAKIIAYKLKETDLSHVNKLYCFNTNSNELISRDEDDVLRINEDCIAFIICLLSRLEEYECNQLDLHDRYISSESWSEKFGFTNIPVVDHWTDYLMRVLSLIIDKKIKPSKKYSLHISHDVDVPFHSSSGNKIRKYFRSIIGSLYRREFQRFYEISRSIFTKYDVFDTYDYLMDISDEVNEKSIFNFIPDNTSKRWDSDYDLNDSEIKQLIQKIISRGHRIGLHCSYNSYQSIDQIKLEKERLQSFCHDCNYKEEISSSRMHYLRWKSWETAKCLSLSGIHLDTSLGFADKIGFRCGTARPYSPFDLINNVEVEIKVLPLHIMDVTLWGYMNLKNPSDMLHKSKFIIDRVKEVNGTLNILWHNSDLVEKWKKDLYKELIDYARK